MKSILILFSTLLLLSFTTADNADLITGTWLVSKKDGKIKIYKAANGKYYGKIIWGDDPNDENGNPKKDTKNPDPSLRSKNIIGLIILNDFTYEDEEYTGGTIYDPQEGKVYTAKMWLTNDDTLQVRGYWGFFYRTETWTRVK